MEYSRAFLKSANFEFGKIIYNSVFNKDDDKRLLASGHMYDVGSSAKNVFFEIFLGPPEELEFDYRQIVENVKKKLTRMAGLAGHEGLILQFEGMKYQAIKSGHFRNISYLSKSIELMESE